MALFKDSQMPVLDHKIIPEAIPLPVSSSVDVSSLSKSSLDLLPNDSLKSHALPLSSTPLNETANIIALAEEKNTISSLKINATRLCLSPHIVDEPNMHTNDSMDEATVQQVDSNTQNLLASGANLKSNNSGFVGCKTKSGFNIPNEMKMMEETCLGEEDEITFLHNAVTSDKSSQITESNSANNATGVQENAAVQRVVEKLETVSDDVNFSSEKVTFFIEGGNSVKSINQATDEKCEILHDLHEQTSSPEFLKKNKSKSTDTTHAEMTSLIEDILCVKSGTVFLPKKSLSSRKSWTALKKRKLKGSDKTKSNGSLEMEKHGSKIELSAMLSANFTNSSVLENGKEFTNSVQVESVCPPIARTEMEKEIKRLCYILLSLGEVCPLAYSADTRRWHWQRLNTCNSPENLRIYQSILSPCNSVPVHLLAPHILTKLLDDLEALFVMEGLVDNLSSTDISSLVKNGHQKISGTDLLWSGLISSENQATKRMSMSFLDSSKFGESLFMREVSNPCIPLAPFTNSRDAADVSLSTSNSPPSDHLYESSITEGSSAMHLQHGKNEIRRNFLKRKQREIFESSSSLASLSAPRESIRNSTIRNRNRINSSAVSFDEDLWVQKKTKDAFLGSNKETEEEQRSQKNYGGLEKMASRPEVTPSQSGNVCAIQTPNSKDAVDYNTYDRSVARTEANLCLDNHNGQQCTKMARSNYELEGLGTEPNDTIRQEKLFIPTGYEFAAGSTENAMFMGTIGEPTRRSNRVSRPTEKVAEAQKKKEKRNVSKGLIGEAKYSFIDEMKMEELRQLMDEKDAIMFVAWTLAMPLLFKLSKKCPCKLRLKWNRERTQIGGSFIVTKGIGFDFRYVPTELSCVAFAAAFRMAVQQREKTYGKFDLIYPLAEKDFHCDPFEPMDEIGTNMSAETIVDMEKKRIENSPSRTCGLGIHWDSSNFQFIVQIDDKSYFSKAFAAQISEALPIYVPTYSPWNTSKILDSFWEACKIRERLLLTCM